MTQKKIERYFNVSERRNKLVALITRTVRRRRMNFKKKKLSLQQAVKAHRVVRR
jgi:hypothetical protein